MRIGKIFVWHGSYNDEYGTFYWITCSHDSDLCEWQQFCWKRENSDIRRNDWNSLGMKDFHEKAETRRKKTRNAPVFRKQFMLEEILRSKSCMRRSDEGVLMVVCSGGSDSFRLCERLCIEFATEWWLRFPCEWPYINIGLYLLPPTQMDKTSYLQLSTKWP